MGDPSATMSALRKARARHWRGSHDQFEQSTRVERLRRSRSSRDARWLRSGPVPFVFSHTVCA